MKRTLTIICAVALAVGTSVLCPSTTSADPPARRGHKGVVSALRVQQKGITWGSGDNLLDTEVVVVFKNKAGYAFGFQLRNDERLHSNRAMLDLLRDAFAHGIEADITYDETRGRMAGAIVQVTLAR